MLVYLAGNTRTEREKALMAQGNTNRLLSYFEYRKKINDDLMYWFTQVEEGNANLFLDSGAYSSMTQNIPIDIDNYCDFCATHSSHNRLTTYAVLDVIGDAEGTFENFRHMEKKGLRPLPAYHGGEDVKYLDYYCANYDYIALGGVAGVMSDRDSIRSFIDFVFNRYPNHKFHAFGITILDIIREFPFHSCDSTSWLMSGANGNIFTPYGVICVSSKSTKDPNHYVHRTPLEQKMIRDYVESRGYGIEQLSNDYNPRLLLNALFMKEFQDSYVCTPRQVRKKKLF